MRSSKSRGRRRLSSRSRVLPSYSSPPWITAQGDPDERGKDEGPRRGLWNHGDSTVTNGPSKREAFLAAGARVARMEAESTCLRADLRVELRI